VTKAKRLTSPPPVDRDTFILPHSLEAEKATLGAALVSTAAADYLVDHLQPPAFFRRVHQLIFECIRELRAADAAIDFITLREKLEARGKHEDVGGPVYISALADGGTSGNVAHYVGVIKDLHLKRVLVAHANQTIALVAEASHAATAIVIDADRRLIELQAGHTESRMQSLRASSAALSKDLEWRVNHQGELTGPTSGFASIDELTLGWQRGDLVVIGARPSIGKTTFALNSAVAAARTGARVAVFSLEMRRLQLEYRILAQLSGVPLTRVLGGHLGEHDYKLIADAMCVMGDLPLSIDDRSGQTVWDIRGACRGLKAEAGLDIVVVDYVQLMPGTVERKGATRNEEITDISRRLKELADEIACPILLLSQLTRESEHRSDPRPKLKDLRESGALEQDADLVCFLHRKNHREGGTTNFIIEKARNGPGGTVNLTLDRDVTTFADGGEEAPAPPAPEPEKKQRARRQG